MFTSLLDTTGHGQNQLLMVIARNSQSRTKSRGCKSIYTGVSEPGAGAGFTNILYWWDWITITYERANMQLIPETKDPKPCWQDRFFRMDATRSSWCNGT